jgi:hypothetical protein
MQTRKRGKWHALFAILTLICYNWILNWMNLMLKVSWSEPVPGLLGALFQLSPTQRAYRASEYGHTIMILATRLWAGRPRNQDSIPSRGKTILFFHSVQTGSEVQPASYPTDTGGSSPGSNVAEAWSWTKLHTVFMTWCLILWKLNVF